MRVAVAVLCVATFSIVAVISFMQITGSNSAVPRYVEFQTQPLSIVLDVHQSGTCSLHISMNAAGEVALLQVHGKDVARKTLDAEALALLRRMVYDSRFFALPPALPTTYEYVETDSSDFSITVVLGSHSKTVTVCGGAARGPGIRSSEAEKIARYDMLHKAIVRCVRDIKR